MDYVLQREETSHFCSVQSGRWFLFLKAGKTKPARTTEWTNRFENLTTVRKRSLWVRFYKTAKHLHLKKKKKPVPFSVNNDGFLLVNSDLHAADIMTIELVPWTSAHKERGSRLSAWGSHTAFQCYQLMRRNSPKQQQLLWHGKVPEQAPYE